MGRPGGSRLRFADRRPRHRRCMSLLGGRQQPHAEDLLRRPGGRRGDQRRLRRCRQPHARPRDRSTVACGQRARRRAGRRPSGLRLQPRALRRGLSSPGDCTNGCLLLARAVLRRHDLARPPPRAGRRCALMAVGVCSTCRSATSTRTGTPPSTTPTATSTTSTISTPTTGRRPQTSRTPIAMSTSPSCTATRTTQTFAIATPLG